MTESKKELKRYLIGSVAWLNCIKDGDLDLLVQVIQQRTQPELVPLDEEELSHFIYVGMNMGDGAFGLPKLYCNNLAKAICSKFGVAQPKEVKVSVEKLEEVIRKWDYSDGLQDILLTGNNPKYLAEFILSKLSIGTEKGKENV